MSTYVILLRAVNLPGYGRISMAQFREALTDLGFTKIETFIQSGNAVVESKSPAPKVGQSVGAALEKIMGAPVGVVVRDSHQMQLVFHQNPFAKEAAADGSKVHVAFLSQIPGPEAAAGLQMIVQRYPQRKDRYHLVGNHIYFHLPDGAADTKFTGKVLDRAVGVMGTARNWNTVVKLCEMSKPMSAADVTRYSSAQSDKTL